MIATELRQYNISFDRKEKDVGFISKQLETHLRERFNVLVSKVTYGIMDGHLVRKGTNEPFIESIKRGRDNIQRLSENDIDFARENAEVIGFQKIDSFLSDPNTHLESKILSISPAGNKDSKYQHNFYDIFTLKEVKGERYVELTRYSSGLALKDYAQKLGMSDEDLKAENFLVNPIKITDPDLTSDDIHRLLHIQHKYMDDSEFSLIWNSSLVQFYAQRYEQYKDVRSFNAFLNAADEVWQKPDNSLLNDSFAYSQIKYFEEKKVRQAGGQCPGKSGADLDDLPFSVSEFSLLPQDQYGERTFKCPDCGKTNVRPHGKLLDKCQHCRSSNVAC